MNVKDLKEGEYYLYGLSYPRLLFKFVANNKHIGIYSFYIYDAKYRNRNINYYTYEMSTVTPYLSPAPKLFRVLYEN